MGANIGTGRGKSRDVDLNVVPFIDLMSCMTAFLLVTAVWSQYSQVATSAKGMGESGNVDPKGSVVASVLLTESSIFVGLTSGDVRLIAKDSSGYDWDSLEQVLAEYKALDDFKNRRDIEIAAEDTVVYGDIVTAMDVAHSVRFKDIGVVDPGSLHVRFKE
jgi:biopolymer transport protein ExbD